MHILMTGGTGLIGTSFIRYCAQHHGGWRFTVLSRQSLSDTGAVTYINRIEKIHHDSMFDAVINLAGAPIARSRWSEQRKQVLLDSRVQLTKDLIEHLQKTGQQIPVWINASAVGWYGDQGDKTVTEQSEPHAEFTHHLCDEWEQCACNAQTLAERICVMRLGLVITADGGFLTQMAPPFKLGLGGPMGNGSQFMPWVHVDDVVGILLFLLQNDCRGIYNATAPNPVTNREFSHTLGKVLKRPVLLSVPTWVLKLALGEMSRLLLTGQKALPERLSKAGFQFNFSHLEDALIAALRN